ncbi:hypothetical protein ACU61A_15870 [Pseudonocardia sichuanensis]
MSAPQVVPAEDTKSCETCGETFTRNVGVESRGRFDARKYCSRTCMGTARRRPGTKPRKAASIAPVPVPRVENGVWRPNAPGWPARPHIPGRSPRRSR